jgi:hypothetical protein
LQLTDPLTLEKNKADFVWFTGDYSVGQFMARHAKKDKKKDQGP